MDLKYGSILKVVGIISDSYKDIETVMLVSNITDGTNYPCKVLDLSTYELIGDFESIEDFKSKVNIVEVVK